MSTAAQPVNQQREAGRSAAREYIAGWLHKRAHTVRPTVAAVWMNVLIIAAALTAVVAQGYLPERTWPAEETWGVGAFKLFALWCLAFLPGWLYIRFLGYRAAALWTEYVLNLHRLGWDQPGQLPEPPRGSEYHKRWEEQRRQTQRNHVDMIDGTESIYRQKFDAYYGRHVARASASDKDFQIKIESLFPVFLTTAVLAVAWTAVLWDTTLLTDVPDAFDVLKFAFLGSYSFIVGMLVRRFYQSDLRPSAYASAVARIITVLVTMAALHAALFLNVSATMARAEVAVAFLVGIFPLAALEALRRIAASTLRSQLPQVAPNYPLNHMDGLNIWYETRLNEEGVEDMQNLTTMNLVDVILHTRVPVGRLVDWVDQAFLLIHLEHADRDDLADARKAGSDKACGSEGATMRVALRRMGIRTATDLLAVFSQPLDETDHSPWNRRFEYRSCAIDDRRMRLLVEVIRNERGLVPLVNWQRNGPRPSCY